MKITAEDYKLLVKQLPCALCGTSAPSHAHHPRTGAGMSEKNSDWLVVPLCDDCHVGPHNGVHGGRAMLRMAKKTELDLVGETVCNIVNLMHEFYSTQL